MPKPFQPMCCLEFSIGDASKADEASPRRARQERTWVDGSLPCSLVGTGDGGGGSDYLHHRDLHLGFWTGLLFVWCILSEHCVCMRAHTHARVQFMQQVSDVPTEAPFCEICRDMGSTWENLKFLFSFLFFSFLLAWLNCIKSWVSLWHFQYVSTWIPLHRHRIQIVLPVGS